MLREAMEVFEKMLKEKNGERLILDRYIPKDGTYRMVVMDGEHWRIDPNPLDIKNDKKKGIIEGASTEAYGYFRTLDYYSKLVDMNKPIDSGKIIHSNNYLSLSVKKECFLNDKFNKTVIDRYYGTLKNPLLKYQKKAKAKSLYEEVEEEIGEADCHLIEQIQEYILREDVWKVLKEGIDFNQKNYFKVFFVYPDKEKTMELYKKENYRYLIPNIYNNNDFNVHDQDEIVGLPNNNMGLNSKKPYLENKTRKTKVPYLLKKQEVLLQAQLFDYFMGEVSRGKYHIYINNDENCPSIRAYSNIEEPMDLESGYYLCFKKEKNEVAILHADVVTRYDTNLRPAFVLKNDMEMSEAVLKKSKMSYNTYFNKLWKLKEVIDIVFFEGKLFYNLDTDAKDIAIKDAVLKRCLMESRETLGKWFYQGEKQPAIKMIDKVSLELIEHSLLSGRELKAQDQFNVRWSLFDYFNSDRRIGEVMKNVRDTLRVHINLPKGQEWHIESDEEFSFGVGQMAAYLLSLSKAKSKPDSLINPFLNAKNTKLIKQKLRMLYMKYNYQIIHDEGGRVAQLLAHLLEYEEENHKIDKECLLMGFVANNLIYEKKKKESEEK